MTGEHGSDHAEADSNHDQAFTSIAHCAGGVNERTE